uniref:Vacuolar-protein sorting-associated protein, putative n=1 Tax=Theileria annulata TaxID=5874 RepID=A0A3B0N721_THEAN
MVQEFELSDSPTLQENVKLSPEKTVSPMNYTSEEDTERSWNFSARDESSSFGYHKELNNTVRMDTTLDSSHSLSYTDSCETYNSSTESLDSSTYIRPETPYNKFLERLKDPSCHDIVTAIKGLVVMLPGNMVRSEVATISHNFIDIYAPKLLSLEIFSKLTDEEKTETVECFEKFTMQKLYPQCYRMDPMDAIEDERLQIQMLCLNWIEPHHLEITTMGDVNILKEAQNHLRNLYKYRSPRDKLIIILNFCRLVVYSIQKVTYPFRLLDVSCDEAFPLLILTIILTNPVELQSCIEFIQYFRHPSRHISEEAYAFTLLVSAVEFIREIGTSSHLKINTQDFQNKYNQNKLKYESRLQRLNSLVKTNSTETASNNIRNPVNNSVNNNTNSANLFDQLKKFNLSTLFKMPLFKQDRKDVYDIIETLEYLESYLLDLPLTYQFKEDSLDPPDLVSDWRALVAMKKHITETIAIVKTQAKKLL